jgi:hypothetical protein
MNQTYLRALRVAYPRLLGSAPIGIGDGWYSLVRDMLDKLEAECQNMQEAERPVITFIEQKYGTLNMCLSTSTTALDHIAFEAEYNSESVCEHCGKPGLLRPEEIWMETLCNACARTRAEKMHWRISNYPWLSLLAAGRTTATQLDGRACRHLYLSATPLDMSMLNESELELMGMLEVPKAELDRSFENLLHDSDKLRTGLDSVLTCSLDQFMSEIQEIRAMRERENKK